MNFDVKREAFHENPFWWAHFDPGLWGSFAVLSTFGVTTH
jgi:hypothetical protein